MNKESVLKIMTDKFVEANRYLGINSGMTAEETEVKIQEGMMAIQYLISEVYESLVANDLLK
jgi:hypothetical protein